MGVKIHLNNKHKLQIMKISMTNRIFLFQQSDMIRISCFHKFSNKKESIISFMSTSITSIFNENTLSVIEGYALSTDKPQFIQSLPDGLEKKVLTALISPF